MVQIHDATATPVAIPSNAPVQSLQRVMLGTGQHNEAWLQALVHDQPGLLPLGSIEPAFADALSVACEVPCAHGYIDNVLITPTGGIVLAEVKLWKNPQARREVVAQVLDYVAALTAMTYESFEQALAKGMPTNAPGSLYAMVKDHPDAPDEATFIDAVSENLARGRVLALAVGDGIRSEAKALGSLLQAHAGAHFTFALVELGLWRDERADQFFCVPSTLLQTVLVERGVVTVVNGVVKVEPVSAHMPPPKPKSLSGVMFVEQLGDVDPRLPAALDAFLEMVAPLGVFVDQKASLSLKADIGGAKLINLGTVSRSGQLWTDYLATAVPHHLALAYNHELAAFIGGAVVGTSPKLVGSNGKAPSLALLLPDHAAAWTELIKRLLQILRGQSLEPLA